MGRLGKVLEAKNTDPNEAEISDPDIQGIPDGEYHLKVEGADVQETKSGDGYYLKLDFVVLAPSYTDFHVWDNITLINPSDEAEKIGDQDLKQLSMACGFDKVVEDEARLIGQEIFANVGTDLDEYKGEPKVRNYITSYKSKKARKAKGPKDEEAWKKEHDEHLGLEESEADDESFDDDDIPF